MNMKVKVFLAAALPFLLLAVSSSSARQTNVSSKPFSLLSPIYLIPYVYI